MTPLARLRRHYDDELLARHGNRLERTPLGDALRERVAEALGSVSYAFGARATFDPASSVREFRIFSTGIGLVLVRPLLDRLLDTAPGVSVALMEMDRLEQDEAVFRRSDGAIGPRGIRLPGGVSGHSSPRNAIPSLRLYDDEWMVVSARRPEGAPPLTLDELRVRPWVSAYGVRSPVMRHLATIGVEPRLVVSVQDFTAVPLMVAGTDRVAALPGRFAALTARHGDVQIEAFPVVVPPIVEAFWWHPNHPQDAGHQWLREQVAAVAAALARDATTAGRGHRSDR